MNEAKRRAATKYFEQEIWNNISKQNSFQDRLLNLTYNKLGKDESVVVRALGSEQLLMSRRNKRLRELMNSAESCKLRSDHSKTTCPSQLATSHHLPTLPRRDRPLTTGQMVYLDVPSSLSVDRRCRSHSALNAETRHPRQESIHLPVMPCAEKPRHSSHSACSMNASLSDSEINKQRTRKTSWLRPSVQLHQRDESSASL